MGPCISGAFLKKRAASVSTADRLFLEWRAERLFRDSPWSCYVHGTVEYDEFREFDARVATDAGLGYRFMKTEATELAGRAGAGFSREIGGPDDRYVPEAVFGFDLGHRLHENHQVKGSVEYSPDITNFGEYRIRSQAAWESLLDQRMNLSLKLSVQNIYDGRPQGPCTNELDYAAMLMWSF